MEGGTEMAAMLEPEKVHARGGQRSNRPGGVGGGGRKGPGWRHKMTPGPFQL